MRARTALGLILLAGLPARPAEPAPRAGALVRPTPFPAGTLDPSGRTAYLANPTGGVDAVDLTTGDLLWQTDRAQAPVLVAGDRLYARAGRGNRLRVVGFDLGRQGKSVFESDGLILPGWVAVEPAPGHSFTADWRLEKNDLVLAWQARSARRHAAGLARFNLLSGEVAAGAAEGPSPGGAEGGPRWKPCLEKLAVRWEGWRGDSFLAVVLEEDGGEQKLVLRAWDRRTGRPAPARELLRGKRPVVLASQDGHFLCVRDSAPSPDEARPPAGKRPYDWSICSVGDGRPAGRAPHVAGTRAVYVLGAQVFYLVGGPVRGPLDRPSIRPQGLQAFDLRSGKLLWERAVAGKPLWPAGK